MKCKNCGASLLDTDKFCNQCGWKVEEKTKCPECGAVLREGARFCPKCGRMIGKDSADGTVFVKDAETDDMPIAEIEQNIVSMTEREMRSVKKPVSAPEPKKRSNPAPEPKKRSNPAPVRKKDYREWEDDDWDEEEDDEEDEGGNIMMIVSVCMAFLILAVAAFLIFTLIRKQPVKDYGKRTQDTENTAGTEGDSEEGSEQSGIEGPAGEADASIAIEGAGGIQPIGTIEIVSNVNVRDNPTTEGSNIIKVAKEGETYGYTGTAEDGNWYIIVLEDGSTGYVFAEYVSVQ
ncbi:MAG: zinc-ribbon domain-containing protein [Roseburia sp.]|nr:zinc-ribbon domain-containing protein [Roseburia sp.]MCM1243647.1 zinc-ribbon domain-containing protein [Roseburia sp.]